MVGNLPPPPGGNAVHTVRLTERLRSLGLAVDNWQPLEVQRAWRRNPARALSPLWQMATRRPRRGDASIVHLHASRLRAYVPVAPGFWAMLRHGVRVITVHSGDFVQDAERRPRLVRTLLSYYHVIITVNAAQRACVVGLGIAEERVFVAPAYLPAQHDPAMIPEGWQARRAGVCRVITSGYVTGIYGYEVLFDAIANLPADRYEFVFAFYTGADDDYEAKVLSFLQGRPNVHIYRGKSEETFLAMLADSDVYVRATTTDGDAITIRESLGLGTPVIATDCVARPPACRLFPTGDGAALLEALRDPPERVPPGEDMDNFPIVLEAYRVAWRIARGPHGAQGAAAVESASGSDG